MAEKKVPYQVNGRQFEGMIVHDDSVNAKRPAIFMQPDWNSSPSALRWPRSEASRRCRCAP